MCSQSLINTSYWCHRALLPPKNYQKHTSISHIAALADMFLHYNAHRHCSSVQVSPTYTALLLQILLSVLNWLKEVEIKYTICTRLLLTTVSGCFQHVGNMTALLLFYLLLFACIIMLVPQQNFHKHVLTLVLQFP